MKWMTNLTDQTDHKQRGLLTLPGPPAMMSLNSSNGEITLYHNKEPLTGELWLKKYRQYI